jgi:histone H3/H4
MSSGTKRSSKDGSKKRRSKSTKSGKDKSARRKSTSGRDSGKKRRSSTVSRKEGRKGSNSSKSNKRSKQAAEVVQEEPVEKRSAREISNDIEWAGRIPWSIRTQPFRRLVNHYARELTEKEKLPDMRFASKVARSVQSAVEGEIVEVLKQAAVMAMHSHRTTVQDQDVTMTARLSKPIDRKEAVEMYDAIAKKREEQAAAAAQKAKEAEEKALAAGLPPPKPKRSASKKAAKKPKAEGAEGKKKSGSKKGKKGAATGVATGHDAATTADMMQPLIVPVSA